MQDRDLLQEKYNQFKEGFDKFPTVEEKVKALVALYQQWHQEMPEEFSEIQLRQMSLATTEIVLEPYLLQKSSEVNETQQSPSELDGFLHFLTYRKKKQADH